MGRIALNILFLFTNIFKNYDIIWALMDLNCNVDNIEDRFSSIENNTDGLLTKLHDKLNNNNYDFVLSYGFCPDISNVCNEHNVKYAAWTYDSFDFSLHKEAVNNECNYIFIFDKWEMQLVKRAHPNAKVYHLPLAANLARIGGLDISEDDKLKYTSDITFIGNLYNHNEYDELKNVFSISDQEYFDDVFCYFAGKWSGESIYNWFSEDEAEYIQSILPSYTNNDYDIDNRYYYAATILGRKLGQLDRIMILNRLADNYNVSLHTNNEAYTSALRGITIKPYVNYFDDMNKVFFLSKINLNVTVRGIRTGIPLRCFDIMASGGFLLSSYQEELAEVFEPGVDMDVFYDMDDLEDKVKYYLSHDDERKKIAYNGYIKVKSSHTYINRLEEIIMKVII